MGHFRPGSKKMEGHSAYYTGQKRKKEGGGPFYAGGGIGRGKPINPFAVAGEGKKNHDTKQEKTILFLVGGGGKRQRTDRNLERNFLSRKKGPSGRNL